MSNVIFDNSTLSAVQRLTGQAPAPRSYDVQGDYSAFENFITHLMFYDEHFFVDDYKEELRENRRRSFHYIRPIQTVHFDYQSATDHARSLTKDIMLEIHGGRISPWLVKDFLESIGLYLTAAWHMRSSDFFLTLKILSDGNANKYEFSHLSALIFHQLNSDGPAEDTLSRYKMISSGSEEIPDSFKDGKTLYRIDSSIKNFAASLNWLALRATFYMITATNFNGVAGLHPIRHNFLARLAEQNQLFDTKIDARKNIINFFSKETEKAVDTINSLDDVSLQALKIPPFAAWAVSRAGSPSKAIEFVLDTRQNNEWINIRKKLAEIEEARSNSNTKEGKTEINKIARDIEKQSQKITQKFHARDVMSARNSLSLSLNASVIPSVSISTQIPSIKKIGKNKHFSSVFRNIVEDIVEFDRLSDVRKRLLSETRRTDDFSTPALEVEPKRFLGRESFWKKPM